MTSRTPFSHARRLDQSQVSCLILPNSERTFETKLLRESVSSWWLCRDRKKFTQMVLSERCLWPQPAWIFNVTPIALEQWSVTWVILPPRTPAMPGDVWAVKLRGCYWPSMGSGPDLLINTLNAQDSPHNKEFWQLNINRVTFEKLLLYRQNRSGTIWIPNISKQST